MEELQRVKSVFTGKEAKWLWKELRRVKNEKAQAALYSLAYKCQELEHTIQGLEGRIANLEKKH